MKITKSSYEASMLESYKRIANAGCKRCPCCGESKSHLEYVSVGELHKGIVSGLSKTWAEGFFKMKSMKCDCYSCLTCGAEWESAPYEWC